MVWKVGRMLSFVISAERMADNPRPLVSWKQIYRPPDIEKSTRLACEEWIPIHFEHTGVFFSASTSKGVTRGPDLDLDESGLLEHPPPACTRQATSDSSSP